MSESAAPRRFAFSRRDPAAILRLAEARRLAGGGVRVLALGGQSRDRVYCAQLLAHTAGQAFVHIDLATGSDPPEEEKAILERLLAFGRTTPVTLCVDGAEALFARRDGAPGERASRLGDYLRRALGSFDGTVIFGMPERVEPDYARLPALDMEVSFRAPVGRLPAAAPVLLPSQAMGDEELLPAHNFQVQIDGVDVGLCAVSAPELVAGPYSGLDFTPLAGAEGFIAQPADVRAAWPTITLRRAISQSKLFYAWKHSQYGGKPLVREVVIRQLDWPGRRVVNAWVVTGCWAKRWAAPAFDARQGAIAEEALELYYAEIIWR